eukprot:jgi/Tetstr1/436200/TSEL_025045.t1
MTTSGGTTFLSAVGGRLPAENGPPHDLPLQQGPPLRYYVTCVRLASAGDEVKGGEKVGGPLPHARLCALSNTTREAEQGLNVHTCMEDVEDSTDEGYEAHFVC